MIKGNLEAEICGVLVGEFCEDDYGLYVSVRAVIEGSGADQGAAHVTYTQETWNKIHERMDEDYSRYEIVGWYHSHPGFGVAFSDMDLFIQENFFAGRGQIAFVSDPLGGEEAICVNSPDGIKNVSRFWVDDRQRQCSGVKSAGSSGEPVEGAKVAAAIESMEQRLRQALQSVDALRTTYYRFLAVVGMLLAVGVVFWIGDMVYARWTAGAMPPKVQAFSPGAVKVGGKWCWVAAKLIAREVPPEMRAALQEAERRQFLAMEQIRQAQPPATTAPASRPSTGTRPPAGTQPARKTETAPPVGPGKNKTGKDGTP